jgi:hypothetical protein
MMSPGREEVYQRVHELNKRCKERIAYLCGSDASLVEAVLQHGFQSKAKTPRYGALKNIKGIKLPTLGDALERCFEELGSVYQSRSIAI